VNALAVIPAKGQSRRVPGKNLRPLAGRPLFLWTVNAALRSEIVTRIVVSTDSDEVARLAESAGANVTDHPEIKPGVEAQDVAVHVVRQEIAADRTPDVVVMLLPTSPFRTAKHIDEAIRLHAEHPDLNVLSVCEDQPHRMHDSYLAAGGRRMDPVLAGRDAAVALNGAIWIATPERLLEKGRFFGERAIPYLMDRESGLDIDWPHEWAAAEWIARERFGMMVRWDLVDA
jgi:CMP-N,N'-diacetyllegionaminic acid synthase